MSDPRRGHGRVRGVGAGGRGLGVFVRGAGGVENVVFSDILIRTRLLTGHWWGKAEPVHVSALLWAPGVTTPGRIGNVTFARDLPALLAGHTDRLVVRDLTVEWAEDVPSYFTCAAEAAGRTLLAGNDVRAARQSIVE